MKTQRGRLGRQIAVMAAAAVLVLTGCTPGSEEVPEQTTLSVNSVEPDNLSPFGSHSGAVDMRFAVFGALLGLDGDNELYSDVLESWETSADGRMVTLVLREGLMWSDGTPMTSADLVMSLTQYADVNISAYGTRIAGIVGAAAFNNGEAESISGLTAVDERTVTVELESPAPWTKAVAAIPGIVVLPEHILGDVPHEELVDNEYFKTFPVVSGPFQFVEWAAGEHIELARNEGWSGGEAGFDHVFLKYLEPSVAAAQLETGEIQVLTNVDPVDADRIDGIEGIEVATAPGTVPEPTWGLRVDNPLFEDRRVRQAMLYAIDREGICENILAGRCSVPISNIPIVAPDWAIPSNEDLIQYEYNPDRARELLQEAGWDEDSEMTMLTWYPAGSIQDRIYRIAQGNLADVGMDWTIENLDVATLFQRVGDEPDSFQALGGSAGPSNIDPGIIIPEFSQCGSPSNILGYCNDELDQLWATGYAETDESVRAEVYHEAFRILNEDVPYLYLTIREPIVAFDERLSGVRPTLAGIQFQNIGEWRWGN